MNASDRQDKICSGFEATRMDMAATHWHPNRLDSKIRILYDTIWIYTLCVYNMYISIHVCVHVIMLCIFIEYTLYVNTLYIDTLYVDIVYTSCTYVHHMYIYIYTDIHMYTYYIYIDIIHICLFCESILESIRRRKGM